MYDAMIFVMNAPPLQTEHPMLYSRSAPDAVTKNPSLL